MVSRENMSDQGKLESYAALVRAWAPRLDLVSPGDLDRFEERHILDSLRAGPLVELAPEGICADVGSGAGLPGIPLAIVSRRSWRLFEPRARRAGFLEEVVRTLDLDCEVLQMTAQEGADDPSLRHVVATARALAPPAQAFELLRPLLSSGGRAVVWHGHAAELPPGVESWSDGIAQVIV
ncbi:MAG: rRNA (guanine527-N7)-methyltransferase [Actinomycetota bacterium]|jgi:16S rRNA (guanine527-N7)-methyltransferase|nr:rRNA (guanine527-N7)-methyltransferase [Actinomycetota bacterium]